MNCTQAQILLAAHRELKNSDVDTSELDDHLEQCSTCRQELARSSFIGEQVRSLSSLEPSPDMHAKLMRALAAEHYRFQQRSPSATPPPEFLKPYLQDNTYFVQKTSSLAAFSTADTGPLPVLRPTRKKQRGSPMGQFAVLGLAAMFLMVLMMGGITALLLLAHGHVPGEHGTASVDQPTNVVQVAYTTNTAYQHVVSAVANSTSIYYTAHGDGINPGWMLEQLDRTTKVSTPLLATESTSPLIVLGSAKGWLVWLQFDAPRLVVHRSALYSDHQALLRSWSLHALALATQQPKDFSTPGTPVTLLSGTFDQDTAPSWVHTPIQGIWFMQNTLLVTTIDAHGVSHLVSYQPVTQGNFFPIEIAKADPGHILTSPTANSDGTRLFWAEEWRSDDGLLHSNVWTQQELDLSGAFHGQWAARTRATKQLFLSDGMSFHPVIVNETLFFLSTADLTNGTPGTTPTTAAVATTPTTSWADRSVYTAYPDETIQGGLFMLPLDGDANAVPGQLMLGKVSSLQAGTDFVLWQTADGYGMYDAVTKSFVAVGEVLNGVQFLAVNGGTAVWTVGSATNTANNGAIGPSATLMTFDWPRSK